MNAPTKIIQISGILLTVLFAGAIVWLYSNEPKSIGEIQTKAEVSAGTYQIDRAKFEAGLQLFRAENFRAARDEFIKADPEKRDAKTQFYIAYAFYREGWGRLYSNDTLFKQGLEAVNRVITLDVNFKSDDDNLKMKTPAELKTELEKGSEKTLDDLNPLKVLRERK